MQEKLIIFLHADTSPDWVVVNQDSTCSNLTVSGDTSELAALANQREVLVIVPSEDVLMAPVVLPKMNRIRLQKALPFALEEQLIDEIDQLHFANGDYQENGELPVAVVSYEKMQVWLTLIAGWNIKADAFIPSILSVPFEDNVIHIVINEVANVRTAMYKGFACDVDNLTTCFNLAITDSGQIPSTIKIHNATAYPYKDKLKISSFVEEQMLSKDELLTLLAKTVINASTLNLLQGEYKTKKTRMPEMQRLIKAATVLAASWLLLLFLYPFISYLILSSRLHQIDGEIKTIYQHHFPAASNMSAPKIRMDDKLRKLEGGAGQNRFLILLGYIGKGVASADNVKLKRLDFQNGQVSLEITAASSESFSGFTGFLASEGLDVKQQNATLSGSHVNATVQVE